MAQSLTGLGGMQYRRGRTVEGNRELGDFEVEASMVSICSRLRESNRAAMDRCGCTRTG